MVGFREQRKLNGVREIPRPLDLTNAGEDLPRNEVFARGRRRSIKVPEVVPADNEVDKDMSDTRDAFQFRPKPLSSIKAWPHTFLTITQ